MKSKSEFFTGFVAQEHQPHCIPDSWLWVEIGALSEIVGGGTPSTKGNYFDGGTIPWVTPADMSGYTNMYISDGRRNITEEGLKSSSARLLPKDSLLFSSRAPIGYVAIAQNPITTNQGFKSFFPTEAYLPHYGYWYLKSIKPLAESMASGTTFLELSGSKAAKIPFPLPPLAEQHRIVAQLDATMQKLEASQERLEKLPVLLKKFRQAVLAAAVSGKLTEAWRAEQPQGGETGADLLDRIRAERRAQWEEKQLAKMKGKQLSLNDSWKQKYEEPAAPDASELPELPEGWVWCRLDNIAEMCLGKMLDGAKNQGTLQPYMGNINVRWGTFDLEDVKMMRFTEDEDERYSVIKGDLVICEGGEPGRAAIWESDSSIKIQKALHRVRPNSQFLLSHFLYYNLRMDAATHRLNTYFTGTGIQHFTGKALARYIFPIPPIAEQQEIVRQVNHYFELADQLEVRFEQAAALVEQLPQALLAKAFSGQLVPQDPNDEPAGALLEQLKTEAPAPGKGQRRKKTNSQTTLFF